MPEQERAGFLAGLTKQEAEELLYCWEFWARPEQLPPPGDWLGWLILAGRGFGKTRSGAEWVISRAQSGLYRSIALIGETVADVRDVMCESGESSIMRISPPEFLPNYEPSKRRLTWPNGAEAHTFSGDEPDQLRGPQTDTVWADEPAKWKYAEDTWANMELGLRAGPKPQWCATTTPRPIALIRRLISSPDVVATGGPTYDNLVNLSPAYRRVIARFEGTRLGQQELHAKVLTDMPGALWTRDLIERNRVREHPDLVRIVVGVDPEASDTEQSAETGIVTGGLGVDGHAYVLDDSTVRGTPHTWGSAVVTAYHKFAADRVAVEVNNGGDMCEYVVKTVDPNVAVKKLHASRGKQTRAEPVAALYEQSKVHHVGLFEDLEDQQCNWLPTDDVSPDRMDALVWLVTELMLEDVQAIGYARAGRARSA